jgi:preprotein translocase subunit SecE
VAVDRKAPQRASSILKRPNVRIRYISDVWVELRKVTWPAREEAWRLTVTVILITVAVGLLLGGIDFIFSELIKRIT